jgi:hypothetical protein
VEVRPTTAIVVIRVWFDGGPPSEFRCRLVELAEDGSSDGMTETLATPDDVCARVRSWMDRLTDRQQLVDNRPIPS